MNPSKPFATVPPRTLSVTGMHCVACQGRVKQVLEELDGIEHVDVDLDAGHAIVHFAGRPVNHEVLVEAVKRAGYQAEPEPSGSTAGRVCELSVTGMSCAACATNVQQALEQVEGVDWVEVDLEAGRVRVRSITSVENERLVHAVTGAGYAARVVEAAGEREARRRPTPSRDTRWRNLALVGGMFTLPLVILHHLGLAGSLGLSHAMDWVSFGLATPVQLVVGWHFYRGAWKGAKATDRVWEGSHGLEWTVPSPAPWHTFTTPPKARIANEAFE